ISVNNRTYALPGLGSFVAVASEHEQLGKVLWAIVTMVIVVLLIDVLLWKPLTAWAEKFRITQNESVQAKTSLVLSILRRSGISDALALVG
ncbi:sulfonate ABC transporter permease, partial [Caulobacter sp. 602-1]